MTDFPSYVETRFSEVEARIRYHARLSLVTLGILVLLSLFGLWMRRQEVRELRKSLRQQEEMLEWLREKEMPEWKGETA